MQISAVCPGSFDPVTQGHLDVIRRASDLYSRVFVCVSVNSRKSGLFTPQERMDLISESIGGLTNVIVTSHQGLLVDFCKENKIAVIVKGLRAVSDFDYELQMAQMNRRLSGVETVFLATNTEYSFLSSSLIKEVVAGGGDVSGLVPDNVQEALKHRLSPGS